MFVHSSRKITGLFLVLTALLGLGCSQVPTEKQSAVDLRPQISFKVANDNIKGSTVFVDNLNMGLIDEYQENHAALRVLPGKHIVSIVKRDQVIYQETIYVGHGISRTIIVQ